MDWERIGLKVGLEIHWEIDTKKKLFCDCPVALINDNPDFIIERYLRPVMGELGEVDIAAQKEFIKKKKIVYQIYHRNNCLVETDEEPPHTPNKDAINAALTISLMLNAKPIDEIHTMRKTIIDGSNVSGFQRTMLVAKNGFVKTSFGNVRIKGISLEEDSARIIESNIFRLDRLGIPEVEIGTEPDIHTPEQALETAEVIGNILKSTGMVKSGLGVVRQDVNVSIKGGARTEIKHVQRLSWIPNVVKKEVERQLEIIKSGKKVEDSVRVAKEDGTTSFLRPLAGAARMYPETDIPSTIIDAKLLSEIKKNLPESWEKKMARLKQSMPVDLAEQIINSEYLQLFEKITKELDVDKKLVASTLVYTLKDLKRRNVNVDVIKEEQFIKLFKMFKAEKISKEAIPIILERINDKDVEVVVRELNLFRITEDELKKLIRIKINENRDKLKDKNSAFNFIIGIVMKEVRGKIDGKTVNEIVKTEVEKLFN